MTYLLVWLDLLQLAYLATTYVAFAAVARLLQGHGSLIITERQPRDPPGHTDALSAILVLGGSLPPCCSPATPISYPRGRRS